MENVLKIYYEKHTNLLLIKCLKSLIAESTAVDMDYKDKKNGFSFIYDDETEGNIEITYGDKDGKTGWIEIKAEYGFEAIEIYHMLSNYISSDEC